jgi:hypothetical protein
MQATPNGAPDGLPRFHKEHYHSLLPSLVELDQKLLKTVNETYTELAELDHHRNTVIAFLAGEDLAPSENSTKHFLSDLAEKERDYYNHLNYAYKSLTGKDLKR